MTYTEITTSTQSAANPTFAYVNAFVDELYRSKLQNIVICPGSRSTPLALAIAEHPGLKTWMHIDERSAAFFALGMAKRSGQPVGLLCSSGTAAANFLPAIVEAKLTNIPLLVLTADRPHELRDNGAPQTIDQNRLYGTHVKWFVEVALPEATNSALRYIRTLADRATATTRMLPAGPVHLNFPFREPLTPGPIADQPLPPQEQRDAKAWSGRSGTQAYTEVEEATQATISHSRLSHFARQLLASPKGIIIAGPGTDPAATEALVQLAEHLHYPILADPLSQLRSGAHNKQHIISSYDAFIRLNPFVNTHQPDVVLRFGAMPTAKPILLYLQHYADQPQIVIDAQNGWNEPTQLATEIIHTNTKTFCSQLITQLDLLQSEEKPANNTWLANWQETEQQTRQALTQAIHEFTAPFEGRVFRELEDLLPDGSVLFAGNSMPVRDLDTFFWGSDRNIHVFGNRGANGIDGIISSALGSSAANAGQPAVLVIGDLSFFHDLNGLLAARLHQLNLVIVLINNDGGGIFSFLPQAAYPDHFEQLWGTPTGLQFQPVIEMYGGIYTASTNWTDFRAAISHGIEHGGLHVVEVQTERESNVDMHRQLWQKVQHVLPTLEQQEQ